MTVFIKGKSGRRYEFEGPFKTPNSLENRSGVYAILCRQNDKLYLIDIGESSQVKDRVQNHGRKNCWKRHCEGRIEYAAYYIEYGKKPSRIEVEQDIRDNYQLPCGEQ
ncbi:hypothetical protein DRN38_03815 [Thermococci archaeon]|nr:MAG: hypothetical protein DRN38_03815 [Thermococci archaeon]